MHPKAFIEAKQGLVHVRSLACLCYLALNAECGGTYHAQDPEPVSTYEILQRLSQNLRIRRMGIPCHGVLMVLRRISPVIKLFGGIAYDPALAVCPLGDYCQVDCKDGLLEMTKK